jgi:hypothetical protein
MEEEFSRCSNHPFTRVIEWQMTSIFLQKNHPMITIYINLKKFLRSEFIK